MCFSAGDPVVVSEDEEFTKANFDKFPGLKPAFQKDGWYLLCNKLLEAHQTSDRLVFWLIDKQF